VRPGSRDATSVHRFGTCSGNVTSAPSKTLSSALVHGLLLGAAAHAAAADDDCPLTP